MWVLISYPQPRRNRILVLSHSERHAGTDGEKEAEKEHVSGEKGLLIDCKAQLWLKEACGKMCPPPPAVSHVSWALEFRAVKLPSWIQKCCPIGGDMSH